MSDYAERDKDTVISMVPQLGSAPKFLARGELDYRIVGFIPLPEKTPKTYKSVLYAAVRRDVVINRKPFWESLYDNLLTLPISIEGRGRNDQIRAENALKGLPVQIETPPEKPSIVDRIMDRNKVEEYERWKERKELGME